MFGNPLLLADDGYQISRSVRLRSSASGYFSRTFSGAPANNKLNTFSAWVKRGAVGTLQYVFAAFDGSSALAAGIWFQNDKLWAEFGGASGSGRITTTAVYRDPSAWYHIVLSIDTTQATASNRVKLYVNGAQVTAFDTATYPSQNFATAFAYQNGNNRVGANWDNTGPLDGYLTEINFIDGQALTPSSFGETDAITGVWKPKKYTGTYGTNGFYLTFTDNSAATATTIGKDYSGNGNNWTPNNISVTAGVTYDSMIDSPTQFNDGGNGRGNYCTLNPLQAGQGAYVSAGNLTLTSNDNNYRTGIGTISFTSGKWYAEVTIGLRNFDTAIAVTNIDTGVSYYYLANSGNKWDTSTSSVAYGAAYTTGDVCAIAFDEDVGSLTFYKNGVSQGVAFTGMPAGTYVFNSYSAGTGANLSYNFGQRPFAYTPPTGFKALNTQNLPEPTIRRGNQFFDATTYTGAGGTQSVTNASGFQPDLVWVKSRSNAFSHTLFDAVRGTGVVLKSNATDAEVNPNPFGFVSAFNSNGFTLSTGSTNNAETHSSGLTYVGWQWKEGATQGFDIVTYTGTGANRTVAHSLGVAPRMIIFKRRSAVANWAVYHASIGNTGALALDLTIATDTNVAYFNNTSPTSSVFTVGTGNSVNASTSTYVAYLFSEVAGFSRFGSYTGNGSADGPFCFTGFRPAFVMVKRTDATNFWLMMDTTRNTYNVMGDGLLANTSGAEFVWNPSKDILSNGFKVRTSDAAENASGGTYIYAAFASNPFKNSLAR